MLMLPITKIFGVLVMWIFLSTLLRLAKAILAVTNKKGCPE